MHAPVTEAWAAAVAPAAPTVDLGGRLLRGCALLEYPYVQREKFGHQLTQGFTGPAIRYLEKLSSQTNFKFHLTLWNGTFTGFVDHMASCAGTDGISVRCDCDIGVGAFTITSRRLAKVDFLAPFSNENHRMIALESSLSDEGDGWMPFIFEAFNWQVWLLIFFALVVYALGNIMFRHNTPVKHPSSPIPRTPKSSRSHSDKDDPSGISSSAFSYFSGGQPPAKPFEVGSLQDPGIPTHTSTSSAGVSHPTSFWTRFRILLVSFLNAYGTFLGFPENGRDASRRTGVHRMMWNMLGVTAGVFLLLVFGAAVTVHLLENKRESRFRTLDDVKSCIIHPHTVAYQAGGASEELWNNAMENSKSCKKSPRPANYKLPKNIEEGLRQLDEKKVSFFFTLEGAIVSEWQRRCPKYSVVGEPFFGTGIGFIVPKNSPYKMPLSWTTRVLREHDAFPSARTIAMRTPCNDTNAAKITHVRLRFFFIVFYGVALYLICAQIYIRWGRGWLDRRADRQ